MSDPDDEIQPHEEFEALFSELHDGSLVDPDRTKLVEHLATCDVCKAAYAEFEQTMAALGQMGRGARAPAPETFTRGVEDTIHQRSAGRFFSRKLADRIPFGWLIVIALVVMGVVAGYYWNSMTGSLNN